MSKTEKISVCMKFFIACRSILSFILIFYVFIFGSVSIYLDDTRMSGGVSQDLKALMSPSPFDTLRHTSDGLGDSQGLYLDTTYNSASDVRTTGGSPLASSSPYYPSSALSTLEKKRSTPVVGSLGANSNRGLTDYVRDAIHGKTNRSGKFPMKASAEDVYGTSPGSLKGTISDLGLDDIPGRYDYDSRYAEAGSPLRGKTLGRQGRFFVR